jgi:hypothetical protein
MTGTISILRHILTPRRLPSHYTLTGSPQADANLSWRVSMRSLLSSMRVCHECALPLPCHRHSMQAWQGTACGHASSLTLPEYLSRNLEEREFAVASRVCCSRLVTVATFLPDHSRLVGSQFSSSLLDVKAYLMTLASRCEFPPNYSRVLRIALNGLT